MDAVSLLKIALCSGQSSVAEIDWLFEKAKASQGVETFTPLHWALSSSNNSTEILLLLLKRGANVNTLDAEGTPLHFALLNQKCSVSAIKCLLDNKAAVNANHVIYGTPLHCALCNKRVNFLKLKLLLNGGADVNAVDTDLRTPLHLALHNPNCKKDVIAALLKSSADVNMQDAWGFSPLHFAARNSFVGLEIYKMLLERGADVSALDFQQHTPLHLALLQLETNYDLVKLFGMNKGQSLKKLTSYLNRYPYQYESSSEQKLESFYFLLKYHALVDIDQTIKDIKPYHESSILLKFVRHCEREIQQMEKEIAGYETSLLDFLRWQPHSSLMTTKTINYCINCILKILSQDNHPLYRDVILSKLNREDVIANKFKKLNVCISKNNNFPRQSTDLVSLDIFSVYSVASYLSNDDLFNFIIAFSHLDSCKCNLPTKLYDYSNKIYIQ